MYYIINNNTDKLALFDNNKERFDKTLQFMPELQSERILETDIITATELQQHPNKCIVGDINIEIIVPDYETQTIEVEETVYEFTTETRTGTRIKVNPETGEPIMNPETGEYETEEYTYEIKVPVMETVQEVDEEGNPVWTTDPETGERIPVMVTRQKSHIETHTEEVQVQVGEHTEVITVRGLILNPDYEAQEAAEERLKLDALTLTPSDVERALYYGLDMDFDDLKALITEKAPTIDLKGLAIEFRANNFYRGAVDKNGNRIIDMVGAILGYTPEDMDYLFLNKQLPTKNN